MSKALRNALIGLVILVAAAALVLVGMYAGRVFWNHTGLGPRYMMSWYDSRNPGGEAYHFGPGGMGFGTIGQAGPGFGMMSPGMMGGYRSSPLIGSDPLSLSEANEAVEQYLAPFEDGDLGVGEVMIFDNHGYAQIVEQSTGIGAMELLIDPVTGSVGPEFGPNMMWNLKYGHMAGSGMMGMMGGFGYSSGFEGLGSMMNDRASRDIPAGMPVSEEEAIQIAQQYLDSYLPGAEADEHADAFYGYYTLHINRDGDTVGMLSVNGYSGQVFVHTWHGNFLEMSETH